MTWSPNFGTALAELLRRLARDRSVTEAFLVFALTRLFVLALFITTAAVTFDRTVPGFDLDDPHPTVQVQPAKIMSALTYSLSRGDTGWYQSIAQNGYDRAPFEARTQHNWAFFPLYPLLMRAAGAWSGQYLLAGALLSNVFFFIALVLLHRLTTALGYEAPTADRAVFYAAVFPVGYFFSLPLTEALFLCLIVASFLAAVRGHWWPAGLLGALASGTRLSGIFLLPALALFYFQRTVRAKCGREIFWLALIPSGLLAFMFFLWQTTGNAFACIDAVAAWQRKSGFIPTTLFDYLRHPLQLAEAWNFRTLNFAAAMLALGVAFFWLRKKHWAFAAFTFLAIALPLSSGTLQSAARYVSVIFPVYIALAILARRAWVDQTIRFTFLVLFALMTLFYALRFSFAAA